METSTLVEVATLLSESEALSDDRFAELACSVFDAISPIWGIRSVSR